MLTKMKATEKNVVVSITIDPKKNDSIETNQGSSDGMKSYLPETNETKSYELLSNTPGTIGSRQFTMPVV